MTGDSLYIHNKPLTTIPEFMLMRRLTGQGEGDGRPQIASGWGLVAKKTNQVITGLELSAPPLTSGQERGG